MTHYMTRSKITDAQKHWSDWGARRPKARLAINNYLSALVLAMSSFVLVAHHLT